MYSVQQAFARLGLAADASLKEVRRAYRTLVRSWHPDQFSDDPQLQQTAQERLKEINAAYNVARKNIAEKKSTELDSPFRFTAPIITPSPVVESPSAVVPRAGSSPVKPAAEISPVANARPFSLNLLLVFLGLGCLKVAWDKHGLSADMLLYLLQIMAIPITCALICNSPLDSRRLRVGYLASLVLFGALIALDAVTLTREVVTDAVFPSRDDDVSISGGVRGGGFPAQPSGLPLGATEAPYNRGLQIPMTPVSPTAPVAPAPAQPAAPVAPSGR